MSEAAWIKHMAWRRQARGAPRVIEARDALTLIERGLEMLADLDAAEPERDALDVAAERFLLHFDRAFPRYGGAEGASLLEALHVAAWAEEDDDE